MQTLFVYTNKDRLNVFTQNNIKIYLKFDWCHPDVYKEFRKTNLDLGIYLGLSIENKPFVQCIHTAFAIWDI